MVYGRLAFLLLSIAMLCTGGCCLSLRVRMAGSQRRMLLRRTAEGGCAHIQPAI